MAMTFPMKDVAMTDSVKIRPCQPDDVDAIYEAVIESKAELSQWMAWCHDTYTRQDAVNRAASRPIAWEQNQEWSFVVVDGDGRLLGTCGIHRLDLLNGVGELGYWVRTSATGKGVATAATRQLCKWAFQERKLHRIEIVVSENNLASQRVAEKAGAVREGLLRERLLLHGRRHHCVLYAILNHEA